MKPTQKGQALLEAFFRAGEDGDRAGQETIMGRIVVYVHRHGGAMTMHAVCSEICGCRESMRSFRVIHRRRRECHA
jgi:hypothetical protein